MTSILRTLSLALLAVASTGAASAPLETSLERAEAMLVREQLADGVYVFRAPSELDYWTATNSVVVVNDDDVVVFDSCTRAVTARAVIAEIRKLTPKPVRTLINSHWHQDHWSGNDEYRKAFPGLRIAATAQTRAYMSHMTGRFFVDELESFGLARQRSALADAIRTGKLADSAPLTDAKRGQMETSLATGEQFAAEIAALPRVLPNLVYDGTMTFWSGDHEFRLLSVSGDASASSVLYLPAEKILVTGDVLVSPEDGRGPPPWTTTTYAITPWLDSLRRLDAAVIVPGQGPAMHDKAYLRRTIELFAAIVDQVHAALGDGKVKLADVQAAVNVDRIGQAYLPAGGKLDDDFHAVVGALVKKAMLEALDGGADVK